jgi:hypothetical protein
MTETTICSARTVVSTALLWVSEHSISYCDRALDTADLGRRGAAVFGMSTRARFSGYQIPAGPSLPHPIGNTVLSPGP